MNWNLESLQPHYLDPIVQQVAQEIKQGYAVWPPVNQWLRALELTDPGRVKVVILGQDPYHTPNVADGLAFSTTQTQTPPSLRNIFAEVERCCGCVPKNNSLESWAQQGVLLLNTTLTVNQGQPLSHRNVGWQMIAREALEAVGQSSQPVVFLLWGKHAESFAANIPPSSTNLVLSTSHPSPLSAHRGFNGCGHFTKANQWLVKQGVTAIDWCS